VARVDYPFVDDFGGGGGYEAKAGHSKHEAAKIPQEFLDEMAAIKIWAEKNDKDAKRDLIMFWILKVPAILVTAGAALLVYFKLDVESIVASAVAAVCIMVDAVRPAGALYRVHRRAANQIHKLHGEMASQFRQGGLKNLDLRARAAEILLNSQKERDRIATYITDAESTLSEPTTPLT
jgi:hypothetical protein